MRKLRPVSIMMSMLSILLIFSQSASIKALSTYTVSNQYTQTDPTNTDWTINQTIPASYELLDQNDQYVLYADKDTLGFKVLDKRSGYIWHSSLDNVTEEDKLNKTWTAFAKSAFSIDFMYSNATPGRLSITRDSPSISYTKTTHGFSADVAFPLYGFKLTLIVTLEEDGVNVQIPAESIKEDNSDYKIEVIHLYPFFGATIKDKVPGYVFIPDGSGALMRFSATTKATSAFYARYYGNDLGMETVNTYNDFANPSYALSLPVTGMVHGVHQNAYLVIIEKGSAFARLRISPSGVTTQFNFAYNTFIYNQSFFQATDRAGAGVTAIQKDINQFDVSMHYRFLTGSDSDYVGMALSYQDYLKKSQQLKDQVDTSPMGIRLEFLQAEKKKFLFWNIPVKMTTIAQMKTILDDLSSSGIKAPQVIAYGWQPLGASSMAPISLKLESSLGSLSSLNALSKEITANQGTLSLYLDPQSALLGSSAYSMRSDLAMSITNKNLKGYNRNKVNYYFNAINIQKRLLGLDKSLNKLSDAELAIDSLGTILYSDFKSGHFLNREDAITSLVTLLGKTTHPLSFYRPNAYVFGSLKNYYDAPLTNSGYLFTSDSVPFVETVLSGYANLYSTPLNFSSNLELDRLRLVDYNVYPSFFVSKDKTSKILNTSSNWIYTSSYEQWGQRIKETYAWMSARLDAVKGATVMHRSIPINGVSVTDYSNAKRIIVNYTDHIVVIDGVSVNAFDAAVTEAVR